MAGRGLGGGIWGLILLIEEHRAALRYDWRARFGKSLDTIPEEFDWAEALDLVRVLRADPSSQLVASMEGWDYPLSREGWILSDLMDVQGTSLAGKKWKTYRRPIKAKRDGDRITGNVSGMTYAETVERLRALGHNLPA